MIATLVSHPEFILQSDHLKAGYFYNRDASCIYWAIQELYKSGIDNIDAFNITNMLSSNDAVSKTIKSFNLPSMQEYIELCTTVARHTLEEYILLVDRIVELSFKREASRLFSELKNDCLSKTNLADLNTKVYTQLDELTEKYIVNDTIHTFGDEVDGLWEQICNRRTETGVFGIPSKFPALNEYFTYEPTELILLKARMKKGKSAFMLNEAMHKIRLGIPTVYFDTEMSNRLFFERLLANLTGVTIASIKSGKYTEEELQRIEKVKQWLKKQPFVHIYNPSFTNEKIYSICKILKHKIGLKFVVFDYIKSNTIEASSQYNELGAKCDFLKNNVAGGLELSVLTATQLNRNGQVADSDKLERYCSVSVLWRDKTVEEYMRDGGEECGNYILNVQLNRLGEQMSEDEYIDLRFDGNRMRIEQAQQHKQCAEVSPF